MEKHVLTVEDDVNVIFEVHGDLQVKGDETTELVIKAASAEDLQVEQQDDQVNIRCKSDCSVRLPLRARLQLEQVRGEAEAKAVDGEIQVEAVHGDLLLRSVGPTKVNAVHGSLEARNISGNFEIKRVKGNLTARNVRGGLQVENAGGNIMLENVDDAIQAQAGGNAVLRLDPAPAQEYQVQAGGNITWIFPEGASAVIKVERASHIVANLPGVETKGLRAPCTITLGEGDAQISLTAGGNVKLIPQGPRLDMADLDFELEGEELADQISQQVEAQMSTLEEQLNAHLANISLTLDHSGLSPDQISRIQSRARKASERASERAQERMRRAQERLERKLASVQQRAEQKARHAEQRARHVEEHARRVEERMRRQQWGFGWAEPPRSPAPPAVSDPVTDDERLSVLRMLQEKKITLEQAEKLLAALEGKE